MRQHFNAKFDTAYHKLRQVLQSATRLIKNCDGTCTWSTLKFSSTFQTISISRYRPLTSLTSYTRKRICIFTIFESLIIHSVCSQISLSKALQEIFSPPNSLCRKGASSVLWGTQIIASYVSILSYFPRPKLRKSLSSKAEPAITYNRIPSFTQSTLTSTKRNSSCSSLSLSMCK